jgi:hypothetical protein
VTVGLNDGYDLCFIGVNTVPCLITVVCLATNDPYFSSLVPLMSSELIVEMCLPVWPMHILPCEHGIL